MHSNSRTGCHCLLCPDRLTDPLCTFRFIRALSGSLAKFAAMRRASSRVSLLVAEGRDAAICSESGEKRKCAGLRVKRR
jgi:hypothetical protein